MNNQVIRAILDRYWEATVALDLERVHEIYHDDIVVEFPQSGERILGKHNIYELRSHYPAKLTFKILRVRGEGNLWITELVITYDGRPVYVVAVMEFRDGNQRSYEDFIDYICYSLPSKIKHTRLRRPMSFSMHQLSLLEHSYR